MGLLERARINLRDVRNFGPSVLTRHLGRLRNDRLAVITVPEAGKLFLRAGDSDMASIRTVFVEKEYELFGKPAARVDAKYKSILASGGRPIIIDAGANIGAASRWFAARYPQAHVVAVEPDPGNASVLRRNFEGLPNCVVVEAAIGAVGGFVAVHNEGSSWGVRTERASCGVPIVTVQDAWAASAGDTPFIVKVDIEGFEKDLFSQNTDWIKYCYVVAIEPHDWMLPGQHTSATFQAAMGRYRFEIYMRGENLIYVQI